MKHSTKLKQNLTKTEQMFWILFANAEKFETRMNMSTTNTNCKLEGRKGFNDDCCGANVTYDVKFNHTVPLVLPFNVNNTSTVVNIKKNVIPMRLELFQRLDNLHGIVLYDNDIVSYVRSDNDWYFFTCPESKDMEERKVGIMRCVDMKFECSSYRVYFKFESKIWP